MVTRWSGYEYGEDLDGDMVEYSDYRVLLTNYKRYFENYATLAAAARRLVEAVIKRQLAYDAYMRTDIRDTSYNNSKAELKAALAEIEKIVGETE